MSTGWTHTNTAARWRAAAIAANSAPVGNICARTWLARAAVFGVSSHLSLAIADSLFSAPRAGQPLSHIAKQHDGFRASRIESAQILALNDAALCAPAAN